MSGATRFEKLEKKGVTLISGVKEYVEITEKGLVIVNKEGVKRLIEGDTVIPALRLTVPAGLAERLKEQVAEVYAIGDCATPGLIVDAIGAGLRTARAV